MLLYLVVLWVRNLDGLSRGNLLLCVVVSKITQWNSTGGWVCLEGPIWLHSRDCALAGMSGKPGLTRVPLST